MQFKKVMFYETVAGDRETKNLKYLMQGSNNSPWG
jgi:hypothetical protein